MQSVARTTRILGVVAVFAAAQAGRAAWNDNDVVLGFNNGTGGSPNDYIINLGQASSVGIGGSSIVNLSSGFGFSYSTFNSTYSGLSSGVSMGVIGGEPTTRPCFSPPPRPLALSPNPTGLPAPPPRPPHSAPLNAPPFHTPPPHPPTLPSHPPA